MSGKYDKQRKPIIYAVLHHTVTDPDVTWQALSSGGKKRLYGSKYPHSYHYHPKTKEEVFYGYHFLVRKDATIERLLSDSDIGWHAGDWEINRSSIGIAFTGDYTKELVSIEQLWAVADLLRLYDKKAGGKLQIRSHKQFKATACPGTIHYNRQKIIDYINNPGLKNPPKPKKHQIDLLMFNEGVNHIKKGLELLSKSKV